MNLFSKKITLYSCDIVINNKIIDLLKNPEAILTINLI